MENLIREGALRLLTTESSCDVILSCQGHRVMAHRVILSMVSPIFRKLLEEVSSDPTVIIFPDVSSNTMSSVLDYIYTGNVVVYSNTIQDFLGLASLLKIHLDIGFSENLPGKDNLIQKNEQKFMKKKEEIMSPSEEVHSKKNQRKLPKLLPLHRFRLGEKQLSQRKLCRYVLPSPWCPRGGDLFGDPRSVDFGHEENRISSHSQHMTEENDSNNNVPMKPFPTHLTPITFNKVPQNMQNTVSRAPSFEKERSLLAEYPVERKNEQHFHKNSSNSLFCRSPDDRSWYGTAANNRQSLEICRTRRTSEELVVADLIPSTETSELSTEEIRFHSKDHGSDHSCSNDGDEDVNGRVRTEKHHKEKPYKCDDCGKSFSQLRNYKYHRSVHEGTKEFAAECLECGKTFNDKGYLSSHMKIHRDKKEYACPHCPKRFNQRVAYNMHLRIHTGVKPHECPTCSKSFSRKMLLKQHQRVHTGERPYTCPECGKTFADRSNMSLHARLHTGVKPYACTLCPKSFTKKHHLKTHMNFHTGLKPYKCQKCGLAFSQSSNMRTHYKKCHLKEVHSESTVRHERSEGDNDHKRS